jgi:ABC-type nitrate/sulfonate/bicarbonate transport system permease component
MLAFGISHFTHIAFAVPAVTLAGIPCFMRTHDEAASASAVAGRIIFFVLEAVYVSFLSGLAAVIVIEFFSGRDGVGYAIINAWQVLETARAVAAIALVWLVVAALSFVVRCTQSIATQG